MSKENDLSILRHSAAHLLAHAVSELYPGTILTIGPATQDGFFYDMLPTVNFKEEDLPKIYERMQSIVLKNLPIEHKQIDKKLAREIFKNNKFKLELIENINEDTVGLATQGDFVDLCRGGHVVSTGQIKHFKLESISGSYWRADRNGQALQRISGTAFYSEKDMQEHYEFIAQAELYDHRKLGKQMDLFSFHDEGVGFPFFHPKGKRVINALISYMRQIHNEYDYQEVSTPTMLSDELWKRSGHYEHYKDKMFFSSIDNEHYAIKPMNCPGSILVYKNRPRSYRELPLKLAEFGHVHRYELSGVLHGLARVRAFTQDDAHIYCTLEQVEDQIYLILEIILKVLNKCEFTNIKFAISTRPESAMGSDSAWQQATDALKNALSRLDINYAIKEGEGAFYGPKIEVVMQDSMKREWQCGTVQVDFFQAENFDLSYVNSKGSQERPVIIHQAIYGSIERFFAILLEHYKGKLPFWLAPVQARILSIADAQKDYGKEILHILKRAGFRAELDESSDPLSGKIKNSQQDKVSTAIVIGGKEVEARAVCIRSGDGKQTVVQLDMLVSFLSNLN